MRLCLNYLNTTRIDMCSLGIYFTSKRLLPTYSIVEYSVDCSSTGRPTPTAVAVRDWGPFLFRLGEKKVGWTAPVQEIRLLVYARWGNIVEMQVPR